MARKININAQLKSQPALQEIKDNIVQGDSIKARLVMAHFPEFDRKEQLSILQELGKAKDEFAIQALCCLAVEHPESVVKFPVISKTIAAKAVQNPKVILAGLAGGGADRIYYMKLAGELKLQQAVPDLIRLLLSLEDKTARLEVIAILGALGNPDAITAISEFLSMDDAGLVAAAISAMARIGTPAAIEHLAALIGSDEKTDRLILDVFAEIQDDYSLNKLNEALQSKSASIRNHARGWLTVIGAKAVPMLIQNLSSNDCDQQIITLNVLQEIGEESASLAIRKLINGQPRNPNVRFAAYEALAELASFKGDYVLAGGLVDPDSNVRLAAARAINRNLDDVLVAGIMNMVEKSGDGGENIIRAIIDGQAGKLFVALMKSAAFNEKACFYLGRDAHQDVRDFFVKLLIKEDKDPLAKEILCLSKKQRKLVKGRVCAVDDSKVILSIYRSIITELGFDAVLFSEPAEAVSWLQHEKPDFLCTDLNMLGMTGLELIKKVRAIYSQDELPVILITTQNEAQDNKVAWKAGVSEILHKPFDTKMLAAVFAKVGGSVSKA